MTSSPPSPAAAPVALSAGGPAPSVTGRVAVEIGGEAVAFALTVPAGPSCLEDLLPIFQGLTDVVVARASVRAGSEGRTVSCREGCAACCRHPVPVSEPEARAIAGLVEGLPEPRRSQIRARFAEATAALDAAGLSERSPDGEAGAAEMGAAYFRRAVACPFLEAERCSIHADRPLACREYAVTSPAAACSFPRADLVHGLPLAGRPSRALMQVGRRDTRNGWLLLVDAPGWAAGHPAPDARQTGPQLVQAVFNRYAEG